MGAHGSVLFGLALLAVLLTWPLATHFSTHVPGGSASDNVTFLWTFWWTREVLASGGTSDLFWTPALFAPYGTNLATHTHSFMSSFLGASIFKQLSILEAQT